VPLVFIAARIPIRHGEAGAEGGGGNCSDYREITWMMAAGLQGVRSERIIMIWLLGTPCSYKTLKVAAAAAG
jgi:hypothetical protein